MWRLLFGGREATAGRKPAQPRTTTYRILIAGAMVRRVGMIRVELDRKAPADRPVN